MTTENEQVTNEPVQKDEPAKIISLPPENDLDQSPKIDKDDDARYEKLMRENAEKRIRAKKAEEQNAKLAKKTAEQERILKELKEKVDLFQKQEEERKLADATEIEKFTHKLEKATKAEADYQKKLEEKEILIIELMEKTQVQERKNFIDNLVARNQIGFSSEWEREGFVNHLLAKNDGEFAFNDEEIVQKITELKKQKFVPPVTPQEGPLGAKQEVPDLIRLKTLLEKPKTQWTKEDIKELDEIQARIG